MTTRNIALCYVRQSFTRDDKDTNSPDRQRANCLAYCESRGWLPEWHEDAEGHKSGTQEINRPGWLALKTRIADPDIVALVANDLSRFHRKGFRMGQLMELCRDYKLELVKAADRKSLDINDVMVALWVMMEAIFHEFYAADISRKIKDSAAYRVANGIAVGSVPFGVMRGKDDDGHSSYLQPTPFGVWLMPDGEIIPGKASDPTPAPGAIWRGYFEAARRTLELYAENKGRQKVANILNKEGYRYLSRTGQAVRFDFEHVRRITANWPEYGGVILTGRAKGRRARRLDPSTLALNPERAVIDIALCRAVGQVCALREIDNPQAKQFRVVDNRKLDAQIFPLSKILCCAQCGSGLTGDNLNDKPRYRHTGRDAASKACTTEAKSVRMELAHHAVYQLLSTLQVDHEAIPVMVKHLQGVVAGEGAAESDREAKRHDMQAEIAHHRQRAKNADFLLLRNRITQQEWQDAIHDTEYEIAALEARLGLENETEAMLQVTARQIVALVDGWQTSKPEEQQAWLTLVIDHIDYDLDEKKITDFRLKPWAEKFMQLKFAGELAGEQPSDTVGAAPGDHSDSSGMVWPRQESEPDHPTNHPLPSPARCYDHIVGRLARMPGLILNPRHAEIIRRRRAGQTYNEISLEMNISFQLVDYVIRRYHTYPAL